MVFPLSDPFASAALAAALAASPALGFCSLGAKGALTAHLISCHDVCLSLMSIRVSMHTVLQLFPSPSLFPLYTSRRRAEEDAEEDAEEQRIFQKTKKIYTKNGLAKTIIIKYSIWY